MDIAFLEKELSYVVLSNDLKPGDPSIPLYNQAYAFWCGFWNDVFRSVGTNDKTSADNFLRHDALSLLLQGEKIVAMHCYTFFNTEIAADREHPFFANAFTPKAMKALDDMKMRTLMTMEYFAVAKDWQKKSKDVAMGVVLLSLSQKFFMELGKDMWIGVPRADIGVAKLCYSMGAVALDQGISIHGVPSDIIGVTPARAKWVGTENDKALVEKLWRKRDIRFPLPSSVPVRKVA